MSSPKLHILTRGEEESLSAFLRRIRDTEGEAIVILVSEDNNILLQESERKQFLEEIAKIRYRVRLASKEPVVVTAARAAGIQVYYRTRMLRRVLTGHPKAQEALRLFSPSLWRQQWRSKLQMLGLLSIPKVRIWMLIGLSGALFLFVLFRLLPSSEVKIWARTDLVTQTMNVMLTLSGATVDEPRHARSAELIPIRVVAHHALVFEDISNEFNGSDASVVMTIVNRTDESVDLRKGSRLVNQAGMVFRIQNSVTVPAGKTETVRALADHEDLYGKIIGDRGNVPAGLRWTFSGLSGEESKTIYAENRTAATGGRSSYRTILQKKDVEAAQRRLEKELLSKAEDQLKAERIRRNMQKGTQIEFLMKNDLIRKTYSGFVLPFDQVGKAMPSITVEGNLIYTVPAYDAAYVLREFGGEVASHVGEGKRLIADSIKLDPDRAVVIEYADNLAWIKMTIDAVALEQYILDPLTPTGARFGKKVRESIAGLGVKDALRIVRNMPEVDRAEIKLWPPWSSTIPSIPSNISLSPQQ